MSLCYWNTSWSSTPACGCFALRGWTGPDCADFGVTTVVALVLLGVMQAVALLLWTVNVRDFYRLLRISKCSLCCCASPSATHMTHLMLVLALSFFLWASTLRTFAYWQTHAQPKWLTGYDAGSGRTGQFKMHPAEKYYVIMMFFFELFAVLAASSISVTWVELAEAATASSRSGATVSRYRLFATVFNCAFGAAMLSIAIAGKVEYMLIVALPFVVVLIVTFTVGRRRLTRLLSTYSKLADAAHGPSTSSATGSAAASSGAATAAASRSSEIARSVARKTHRSILAIKRCTLRIIVSLLLVIVCGGVATALYSAEVVPGGWRSQFSSTASDYINPVTLMHELTTASMLCGVVALSTYSHRSAKKLFERKVIAHERILGKQLAVAGAADHLDHPSLASGASRTGGGTALFKHVDRDLPTGSMDGTNWVADTEPSIFSKDQTFM
jgi:hypothetical protein